MSYSYETCKLETGKTTDNLEFVSTKLKQTNPKLKIDKEPVDSIKKLHADAVDKQKSIIELYENDKDKFRALRRYGDALKLIEKLINILPYDDLSGLSLDELCQKVEELIKNRKRNDMQLTFIFLQNLYSNALKNLLTVEKDFQSGNITSIEALSSVKNIKHEVESHNTNVPSVLDQTQKDVSYLIESFERSYSKDLQKNKSGEATPLVETTISPEHQILFKKLNSQTTQTIQNIENISLSLTSFDPQVNLTGLLKSLKTANDIASAPVLDESSLNSTVASLEFTTNSLITEQSRKNEQSENISKDIETATSDIKSISSSSLKDVSTEMFKDASTRAVETKDIIEEGSDLVDNSGLPTSNGIQVANTIISQMEADQEFCEKVAAVENVESTHLDLTQTNETENLAYDMKDKILTLEEKQEMVLKLAQENPELLNTDKKE